jgi:hypothetical protein
MPSRAAREKAKPPSEGEEKISGKGDEEVSAEGWRELTSYDSF